MNQSQMTQAVADQVIADGGNLNKADVNRVLLALAGVAQAQLKAGEEVTLGGLGKLKVTDRAAKTARNPRTGETVEVPAKKAVKFVPVKALKELLQA